MNGTFHIIGIIWALIAIITPVALLIGVCWLLIVMGGTAVGLTSKKLDRLRLARLERRSNKKIRQSLGEIEIDLTNYILTCREGADDQKLDLARRLLVEVRTL